jgi:hypothetical protein
VLLILAGNQFDFRKNIVPEEAILKVTNEILNGLNSKRMAGSIFCDLEKAFDFVSELPYCRVIGKAKLLLESYLQNRYQRVQIINLNLNSNTVSK